MCCVGDCYNGERRVFEWSFSLHAHVYSSINTQRPYFPLPPYTHTSPTTGAPYPPHEIHYRHRYPGSPRRHAHARVHVTPPPFPRYRNSRYYLLILTFGFITRHMILRPNWHLLEYGYFNQLSIYICEYIHIY